MAAGFRVQLLGFRVSLPGCVVKLNFSLAIGPVRGKSWGGLHGWLPVAQTGL